MVTAVNPDRRSCARGRRRAIGVLCLLVGMWCTGCGREQEARPSAPATADAAPSRATRAARPAAKAPRPAATVEKPAPAPAGPTTEIAAEKPAPVIERTETLEEIIDSIALETSVVAEKRAPAAEEPALVVAAEPLETPPAEVPEPRRPLEPESPPDHASLAEAALERGDCELALEHFRQARQVSPDDLGLRLREAETYRRCGWPGEALALLGELDARSRAHEAVAAEIAEAHRVLSEPGRAAMAWELRYIHHPKAWRAAARAAEAWMEAGQHKPAQWWFEQARGAAPNTPEVHALTSVIQSAAITNR